VPKSSVDFFCLLETLAHYKIDFIIVGGVGAILHGAPITTFDLDIVHSRHIDNVARLIEALESLDTIYRGQFGRIIKPDATALLGLGHHLFETKRGPLNVLGMIGKNRDYDRLFPYTVEMDLSGDLRVHTLDLKTLIAVKKETFRDKDRVSLMFLQELLKESSD